MAEKVIGFSINVKGTDSQVGKLQQMKTELSALEKQFASYTNKSSVHALALQTRIKGLSSDIRKQQKEIIDNGNATKNAAGSYNDLVARLKQTTIEWRKLSKEERENTALGRSLTKQKKELGEQLKKLDATVGNHQRNVGNYSDSLNNLRGGLGKLATAFGVTFAASQLIDFGKESVRLALQAEGVERAFRKLNNPQLLDQLREATKGTVSDLELMQAAVQAKNFKIPLEKLGGFFQFAQLRARETGEEVGKLTEQLVLGLGRQSVQRLDDLGLSMKEIQKETKRLGGDFQTAVSNIINKELESMDVAVKNNADTVARWGAIWENTKVTIGEFLVDAGGSLLDFFDILAGKTTQTEVGIKNALSVADKGFKRQAEQRLILAQESEEARLNQIKLTQERILEVSKRGVAAKTEIEKRGILLELQNEQELLRGLRSMNQKHQKELTEKELEEIRKRNAERLKANAELIKQLQDQEVSFIKDEETREKAAAGLRHSRAVKDIVDSKADQEVKNDALISQQLSFEKEILDIEKKYDELHAEQRDRINEEELKDERENGEKLRKILAETLEKRRKDQEDYDKGLKELQKQNNQDLINGAIELGQQLEQLLFQNERDRYQREFDAREKELSARHELESTALEERLKSGQITEAQYKQLQQQENEKFAAQDLALQKEAFEKEKKLRRQQIGIELAIELARIASAAAANPTNAVTYGAAGVAQYAIQAGIAVARSGIQLAAVDAAEFADGGITGKKITQGDGVPVTKSNGDNLLATVKTGEVILNEEQQAMLGGSRTFAAIGVPGFADGGRVPVPSLPSLGSPGVSSLDLGVFAQQIINGINDKKVVQYEKEVRGVLTKVGQIESNSRF